MCQLISCSMHMKNWLKHETFSFKLLIKFISPVFTVSNHFQNVTSTFTNQIHTSVYVNFRLLINLLLLIDKHKGMKSRKDERIFYSYRKVFNFFDTSRKRPIFLYSQQLGRYMYIESTQRWANYRQKINVYSA